MAHNEITAIDLSALATAQNDGVAWLESPLQTLNLDFNKISAFPVGLFARFPSLTTLSAASNQITTIPNGPDP